MPKKISQKGLTRKLDRIWSQIIKQRANFRCERCGSPDHLNAHHIQSRAIFSTRWSLENGVCLCAHCHMFSPEAAHKSPLLFIEWVRKTRGSERYDALIKEFHNVQKVDKEEILTELLKEVK